MAIIGTYYTIEPKDWLFPTHGDVVEAKRRAKVWFDSHGTYDGAEQEIEEPVKMGSSEKEADIAIKNDNHRVFLYVETKKGNITPIEFEEAQK